MKVTLFKSFLIACISLFFCILNVEAGYVSLCRYVQYSGLDNPKDVAWEISTNGSKLKLSLSYVGEKVGREVLNDVKDIDNPGTKWDNFWDTRHIEYDSSVSDLKFNIENNDGKKSFTIECPEYIYVSMTEYTGGKFYTLGIPVNQIKAEISFSSQKSYTLQKSFDIFKQDIYKTQLTTLPYSFCNDPNILSGFRVVAALIFIMKIIVPIIIIMTGMYSFFKATIDQDSDATKKATELLIKKIIMGVTILFIPTIITVFISLVKNYDETESQFSECTACMFSIKKCNELINKYK